MASGHSSICLAHGSPISWGRTESGQRPGHTIILADDREPGDLASQAAAVLGNLEFAVAETGLSRVPVTVWNVVADRFGSHDVPSTLLGVTVMG